MLLLVTGLYYLVVQVIYVVKQISLGVSSLVSQSLPLKHGLKFRRLCPLRHNREVPAVLQLLLSKDSTLLRTSFSNYIQYRVMIAQCAQ